MTPEERNLLTQFLSDLSKTSGVAKEAEAAQMIDQAFRSNPDAAYVLTQHALLADQALHQAQPQIEELQAKLNVHSPRPSPPASSAAAGSAPAWPSRSGAWAQAAQPQ